MQPEATRTPTFDLRKGATALAVIVLGFLAYTNTLDGEFVWDDVSSVLLHENVRDPSKLTALFTEDQHAFAGGQGNFYRPLVSVSFMIDYVVSTLGRTRPDPSELPHDLGAFVFHLSSVLWHITAALCLLALMSRLGTPGPIRAAVPLLYVVHPLHTEAVAYISGRADSMSAAFMFAGLYFATWHEARRRYAGLALSLVCFSAGLLSKESSFIFPALLGLGILLVFPGSRPGDERTPPIQRWLPLLGSVAILGVYATLRMTVLNFGSDSTPPDTTLVERGVEALQAFALYIGLLFAPHNLHMERTLDAVPAYTAGIGLALLLACIGTVFAALKRRQRRAAFAMAWFLVSWLPISGLFPLNAPMAEHWMYVPMAGFLWALAEMLWPLFGTSGEKTRHVVTAYAATALLAIGLGALLAVTAARNRDWNDNESIYSATLRESPDSIRVHFNLATTYDYFQDNPTGARRHYSAVVEAYRARKEDDPEIKNDFWNDELKSYLSLGDLYFKQRRFAESFNHYEIVSTIEAIGENAALRATAVYGMGRCLLATGNREGAIRRFEIAIQALPQLAPEIQALLAAESPLG